VKEASLQVINTVISIHIDASPGAATGKVPARFKTINLLFKISPSLILAGIKNQAGSAYLTGSGCGANTATCDHNAFTSSNARPTWGNLKTFLTSNAGAGMKLEFQDPISTYKYQDEKKKLVKGLNLLSSEIDDKLKAFDRDQWELVLRNAIILIVCALVQG
jgi:hypothetical protein